jgi:uncharacterized protein
MQRRDFLQFLGLSTLSLGLAPQLLAAAGRPGKPLPHLPPSLADKFITADGLNWELLIRWGDKINAQEQFGSNNDFIAFHSLSKDRGILWVNHEYTNPLFLGGMDRTRANAEREMKEVGGSLLEVQQVGSTWKVVENSSYNRRLDAMTKIPLTWPLAIAGEKIARGTLANCAGGYTPWGTFLTAEENYDAFVGEVDRQGNRQDSWLKWEQFQPMPPEHYGWIVEVEPLTGKAQKLISMGRCAHECATVYRAKNGKAVAYTGDDASDQHLYKFISDSADSLTKGKLYVASLEKKRWLSLDIEEQPILKSNFKNQTEVQIHLRAAAKLLGATPLARPEDIEIDPLTGHVFIALTNNKSKQDYHGSILKIMENADDHGSLTFDHSTFLTGGQAAGFACPDNLAFDKTGNLWFTSDISGKDINQGPYAGLGNNALYVFIRKGQYAGQVLRVAIAPVDAELTGPCFSPDYSTLFLAVQHPGETSKSLEHLTSHWPDGGIPKSSVVTLQGPLLERIISGKL